MPKTHLDKFFDVQRYLHPAQGVFLGFWAFLMAFSAKVAGIGASESAIASSLLHSPQVPLHSTLA